MLSLYWAFFHESMGFSFVEETGRRNVYVEMKVDYQDRGTFAAD